jgi:periplasmic protein TonB
MLNIKHSSSIFNIQRSYGNRLLIHLINKLFMELHKILSADLLDLVFENRNKDYGAYDLRKTYHKRVVRSLVITSSVALLALLGSALANTMDNSNRERQQINEVTLQDIKQEEKKIETPPPPVKPVDPPQVEMKQFTPPIVKKDDDVEKPPPPVDDLKDVKIADVDKDGIKDMGFPDETVIDDGKNIIEQKKVEDEDRIHSIVQIQAAFPGGDAKWRRYLEQNCNGQVATDNGAPAGNYTTMVQFVVDKDGNISEVKALTSHGYGMEEEAKRVIRNGPKWEPAIQNGIKVKAYRNQPITFQVTE